MRGKDYFAQFEEFVAGGTSREDGHSSAYRGEGEG